MNRRGLLLLAIVLLAGISVAAVLVLSGGSAGGVSPPCLAGTVDRGAALPGTPVDVSPAPDSHMANPRTQISFLGVPAGEVHGVSVVGQRSGFHTGHLRAYSQGDGASFVPDTAFDAGERVRVRAVITGKPAAFSFGVDTPYSTAKVGAFPNPPAAPGEYESFATLPGVQAPVLSIAVADHDPAAGDVLMTNGPSAGRYGPLIYTPQGRLVWFRQLPRGLNAENLSVQSYEGQHDLTFWQGRVLSLGFGQGEDVVVNDRYQTVASVRGGNGLPADLHDFKITPHDISYTTAYNPIRCNLRAAGGARDGAILDTAIQETDLKTGLVRWEWHSLDHIGVAESETSAPKGASPWDYFHLNAIDPEPDGNILITARNTWASYQLQGTTSTVLWRLGGNKSTFTMDRGSQAVWQHDGRILADGQISVFDDGSNPPIHHQSRALLIGLDFKRRHALLRRVYTHPGPLLSVRQGNMQTLANGNTVVGYGSVPEISEYAVDGSLLYDAHLSFDMDSYRAFRFPWTGRPLSPPAVTAGLNSTREETIVHASWNGATGLAAWRIFAGGHPRSLQAQSTIPARDFETSAILPRKYAYVAVEALDSSHQSLAKSNAVKTTAP